MYRTIDAAFWTDPKVRKLNPLGRLLLLYLITNPHTHVSGLYYLPPLIMQHETGLPKRTLDTLSANLDTLSLSYFDPPNELVWVVNMFKFQGSGQKNTLSAAHHIKKDIHNSYLINRFIEKYPPVAEALQKIGYSVGATPDPGFRIPEQYSSAPNGAGGIDGFERFWEAYPKKREKLEAQKVWKQIHPTNGLTEKIIGAVELAKQSYDWQKDNGQFIPNPAKYLRRGNWDDDIKPKNKMPDKPEYQG